MCREGRATYDCCGKYWKREFIHCTEEKIRLEAGGTRGHETNCRHHTWSKDTLMSLGPRCKNCEKKHEFEEIKKHQGQKEAARQGTMSVAPKKSKTNRICRCLLCMDDDRGDDDNDY